MNIQLNAPPLWGWWHQGARDPRSEPQGAVPCQCEDAVIRIPGCTAAVPGKLSRPVTHPKPNPLYCGIDSSVYISNFQN